MHPKTLAKLFQESKAQPVILGDMLVVPIYRIPLAAGKWHVRVERISAKNSPVQGLRLKVDRGHITVAGQKQKDIVYGKTLVQMLLTWRFHVHWKLFLRLGMCGELTGLCRLGLVILE